MTPEPNLIEAKERLQRDLQRLDECAGYHVQFGTPRDPGPDNRWNRDFAADLRAFISAYERLEGEVERLNKVGDELEARYVRLLSNVEAKLSALEAAARRVTDHLETWAADHYDERTAETDAAIYCARQALSSLTNPGADNRARIDALIEDASQRRVDEVKADLNPGLSQGGGEDSGGLLFERVARMLETREFVACWNGGAGHDMAGSQGFDNASDYIAWTIRQAYRAGWDDREDDLILGVDRIMPKAPPLPVQEEAPSKCSVCYRGPCQLGICDEPLGDPAEADAILSQIDGGKAEDLLRELYAMVKGECPRLLDEDNGGNSKLALDIESALSLDGGKL